MWVPVGRSRLPNLGNRTRPQSIRRGEEGVIGAPSCLTRSLRSRSSCHIHYDGWVAQSRTVRMLRGVGRREGEGGRQRKGKNGMTARLSTAGMASSSSVARRLAPRCGNHPRPQKAFASWTRVTPSPVVGPGRLDAPSAAWDPLLQSCVIRTHAPGWSIVPAARSVTHLSLQVCKGWHPKP